MIMEKLQEVELFIRDENEDGVFAVSLVESPAIEENFIALSSHKIALKVVNDEKRIVIGLALVPEKRIYRKMKGQEFNIYFSAETIAKTSELFMKKLNLNNVTSEHEKPVTGVTVIESWIVEDTDKDKTALYNLNAPVGSWAITMKVYNDEEWDKIKAGDYKGFSIEGIYQGMEALEMRGDIVEQLKAILNENSK
jgi:hypothetical protein